VIHEHRLRVAPDDIDELGHANNLRYVHWIVAAATGASEAAGWPFARYRELGAAFVVRRHVVDYLRPAFAGDTVVIRTWIELAGRASSVRRYELLRLDGATAVPPAAAAGERIATAETHWAFVDLASGRPRRIAPALYDAFGVAPPG
jgi:acyl-CoA thioester hydrolase